MNPLDRQTLQVLDAILRDNLGNRITPALVNGIVNTLHDHMAARPAQAAPQDQPTPAAPAP